VEDKEEKTIIQIPKGVWRGNKEKDWLGSVLKGALRGNVTEKAKFGGKGKESNVRQGGKMANMVERTNRT